MTVPTPPYAVAPPPPPARSRKDWWLKGPGLIVLIAALGVPLGLLLVLGGGNTGAGTPDDIRKQITVQVSDCEMSGADGLNTAKVSLVVGNISQQTRSARIEIEYRDGNGRRLDTDTAYIRDIEPGDTVSHQESTILDGVPTGQGGTCAITSIR